MYNPSVPAQARRRQANAAPHTSSSSDVQRDTLRDPLVALILDGAASAAANAYGDARVFALQLYGQRHYGAALRALELCDTLRALAALTHEAAEMAAAAQMGGEPWNA